MPHTDPEPETATSRTYECLDCGATVTSDHQPVSCPECGSALRNKSLPLE